MNDISLVFACLLIFLTVVGNAITIIVILTRKKLRNNHGNRFLLSLAAADFGVGLFVMLPSVLQVLNDGWVFGMSSCMMFVSTDITFCSASIYSLIGISIDRHYAVFHPFEYATKRKIRTVTIMVVSAWLVALLISTPMYIDAPGFSNFHHLMNETTIKNTSLTGCMPPVDPDSSGFVLYSGILAFIIPFFVLIGLQSSIMYRRSALQTTRINRAQDMKNAESAEMTRQDTVLAQNTSVRSTVSNKNKKTSVGRVTELAMSDTAPDYDSVTATDESLSGDLFNEQEIAELQQKHRSIGGGILSVRKPKREMSVAERKLWKERAAQRKITTMMAVIVGTFALCWFPFAVMFFLLPHHTGVREYLFSPDNTWLIEFITWIGYINSSLNPIIYAIMNPEIKTGLLRLLGREPRK